MASAGRFIINFNLLTVWGYLKKIQVRFEKKKVEIDPIEQIADTVKEDDGAYIQEDDVVERIININWDRYSDKVPLDDLMDKGGVIRVEHSDNESRNEHILKWKQNEEREYGRVLVSRYTVDGNTLFKDIRAIEDTPQTRAYMEGGFEPKFNGV